MNEMNTLIEEEIQMPHLDDFVNHVPEIPMSVGERIELFFLSLYVKFLVWKYDMKK